MAQAARRIPAKDPEEKLAHRRLTVLELAERLGNVSEACRRGGIDRTSSHGWKRRFQLQGLDGLKDLPPIARNHPMTTAPEVVARIEELALARPAYGCNRIEALLALGGEPLSAGTFPVGTLKGIGRVYLHAVVDPHGSYAFGFLHVSKQPEAAVAVLHNDVLPFYRDLGLEVGAVLTDDGREFRGTERHAYELYLALNDIEHRKTRVGSPRTNGFVERFHGTVLEESFRPALHGKLFEGVEALRADLDAWLVHYTRERPRLGCRNQGRRPWETVELFVRQGT